MWFGVRGGAWGLGMLEDPWVLYPRVRVDAMI